MVLCKMLGSGERIRTFDLVVTLIPILSYWRGLSHQPKTLVVGRLWKFIAEDSLPSL
jgi:hypothetical protein